MFLLVWHLHKHDIQWGICKRWNPVKRCSSLAISINFGDNIFAFAESKGVPLGKWWSPPLYNFSVLYSRYKEKVCENQITRADCHWKSYREREKKMHKLFIWNCAMTETVIILKLWIDQIYANLDILTIHTTEMQFIIVNSIDRWSYNLPPLRENDVHML